MANDGDESRERMDLNLYLGLPRSPRPRSLDLGLDLSLSSLPLSSSSTEEIRSPAGMAGAVEPSDVHTPYSPSRASYTVELPHADVMNPVGENPSSVEYTPFFPTYEPPYGSSSYIPLSPMEQESQGADTPYSPSNPPYSPTNVQVLSTTQESNEPVVRNLDPDAPYDPLMPPVLVDEPFARVDESHVPYSPTYMPTSNPSRGNNESAFSLYPPAGLRTSDILGRDDGPSLRREVLPSSEELFQRLVDPNRRWRLRRFRSSIPYGRERMNFVPTSAPSTEQLLLDIMSSHRSSDASGKDKVPAEGTMAESSEEEAEDKSRNAANFECNICFDMAKEPVVTSCGHLFCWSCLYQWLHVHSEHKECPVCKGEVIESNIIPIYGRGSSQPSEEKKVGEDAESGVRIPPRPRGNRFESFRQHFRPIYRSLGEGIASSWRRIVDEEMHRSRHEAHGDPALQGVFDLGHRRILTRLRARRIQRDDVNLGSASNSRETTLPRNSAAGTENGIRTSLLQGLDFWQHYSLYGPTSDDPSAAMNTNLGGVVERLAYANSHYGASTSSANLPNPEPLVSVPPAGLALSADQASVSSTMAVIQGDVLIPEASAEPNSAGSSRSLRRRLRSSASTSLDADGGSLHARKRRRLN